MTDNSNVDEKIFCFWTDDNPITPNRLIGLETMRNNLKVPIDFLDGREISKRILPDVPLHPGYKYLSAVHKSDYLRCYFMHHFGGGYADLKFYTEDNNWKESFRLINNNREIDSVGVQESITGGRRPIYNTPDGSARLIATCYFICRKHSKFTTEWYARMMAKMDEKYEALKSHPAEDPFDRSDKYPMKWCELLGLIFHDVVFEMSFTDPYAIRHSLKSGRDNTKAYR